MRCLNRSRHISLTVSSVVLGTIAVLGCTRTDVSEAPSNASIENPAARSDVPDDDPKPLGSPESQINIVIDNALVRAKGKPPLNWTEKHDETWRRHIFLIEGTDVRDVRTEGSKRLATLVCGGKHIQSTDFASQEEAATATELRLAHPRSTADVAMLTVDWEHDGQKWTLSDAKIQYPLVAPGGGPPGILLGSEKPFLGLHTYFEPSANQDKGDVVSEE